MRFTGKRVFVTGAAAGIGEATVQLFREEGANVVGVDIAEVHIGLAVEAEFIAVADDIGIPQWRPLPNH